MKAAIHAAIESLLKTDATFLAAVSALNLGAESQPAEPQVLKAFRDPRQIPQHQWPAWILEAGDSEAEGLTNADSTFGVLGFSQQGMACDVLIGAIWHQGDRDTAYDQRLALEAIFVDLFLRHPDPGGATLAWVRRVEFDRGALHPTQTAMVTVRVEYAQERSA